MAARLLKYVGKDPGTIDPYWDFQHEPGEPYDLDALRLFRTRIFLSGSAPRLVQLRLRITPDPGRTDEPINLPPFEHVHRFARGAELSPGSYVQIASNVIVATPPVLMLALDLTGLPPGEVVFLANVLETHQDSDEMRLRIRRRPFYTLYHPVRGAPPRSPFRARSCTGLREIEDRGGRLHLAAAHRWKVFENAWAGGDPEAEGYTEVRPLDVVAVTRYSKDCDPQRTHFRVMDPEMAEGPLSGRRPEDSEGWRVPADHARRPDEGAAEQDPSGIGAFGLPFPVLIGLPKQPDGEGNYPRALRVPAPRDDPQR